MDDPTEPSRKSQYEPIHVTAWRKPLELGRRAAEDLPLLPSTDHIMLVSLAALVGLIAGLTANTLRVGVRLVGALFFEPAKVAELLIDSDSELRRDFVENLPGMQSELLTMAVVAALTFFVYGGFRERTHRQEGLGRHSRAFLVGVVMCLAALWHWAIQLFVAAADALTPGHSGLLEVFQHTPWWGLCMVALIGGSLVGFVIHRFEEARGHGVPDVMASVALSGGMLKGRRGPIFAGAAALTVASMGSVGLEGPVVVFGSASASWLGKALSLGRERMRTLVAAGAAAGISASFNAPIAGALFALEIVVGDFGLTMFSPVVIASVVGTVVHRSIEGNHPALSGVSFTIDSGYEILIYAALGLICGGVGTLFVRELEWLKKRWAHAFRDLPPYLHPAIGFVCIVAIAVAFDRHEILGSGYDTVSDLLDGKIVGLAALSILAAKFVATGLTLGSGGVGGVFLPSLFIGACTGSLFGTGAQHIFGDRVAGTGSFALVGMGALLTAVQQAPLTAVVMVFELCNEYSVILPLLVACILSTLVATRALGMSIYQRVLKGEGIVLSRGKETNLLRSLKVRDTMRTDVLTIHEATPLGALERIVAGSEQTTYPLVDGEGKLTGVLTLTDLRYVLFEHEDINDLVVAGELGSSEVHVIHPDDSLADALSGLAGQPSEHLIVVSPEDECRVVGLLSHQRVMAAYRKALEQNGLFERERMTYA